MTKIAALVGVLAASLATTANGEDASTQFDFLIGDHDVTLHAWAGTGWTPPRPVNARWRGWRGLDEQAIYDEWQDPQSGVGVNVRMYDPDAGLWKMMWISTTDRQPQDLRAELRGERLVMWQLYPPRPGWKAEFETIDACRWARVSYTESEPDSWQPQFRLVASKRDCG